MARTYRQLDLGQRRTLLRLVEARTPVGDIAQRLDRHPSTIYRELGRDRFRDGDRGFRGHFPPAARGLPGRRRRRGKPVADDGLRTHLVERLAAGRSPQQLRLPHPARGPLGAACWAGRAAPTAGGPAAAVVVVAARASRPGRRPGGRSSGTWRASTTAGAATRRSAP